MSKAKSKAKVETVEVKKQQTKTVRDSHSIARLSQKMFAAKVDRIKLMSKKEEV